jgi:hypothetical protein
MSPTTPRPAAPPGPATLREPDLALLHALQEAPRAPWVDVARRLGVDREVAAARWRALTRARVAWQAVYPGPRWWRRGRHQLAWVEITPAAADLDQAVHDLARTRRVLSLDVDLDGTVLAALAAADYRTAGRPLLPGVPPARGTHLATDLYSSASRWRTGALPTDSSRGEGPPLDAPGAGPADDRIRSLGGALGPDPRRPVTDIAAACRVSHTTATRWLDHALTGGDLGIRVEVTPDAVARPVGAHWWLRAPDIDHDHLVDVLLAQTDVRWVAGVVSPTGATVLAAVWTHDLPATRHLAARVAARCPTATTVRLAITARPAKRLGWLLDPDTGRRGDYVPLDI